MNIGFLTDVDGYRAPIHPESFEKYSMDLHLEKNIFDYLNYPYSKPVSYTHLTLPTR